MRSRAGADARPTLRHARASIDARSLIHDMSRNVMKTSPKLVLALLAAVSCAAGAETYSSQADQARRERNREEALAHYRAGNTTARDEAHDVADSARRGGHKVAESSRHVGHEVANEGRHVG